MTWAHRPHGVRTRGKKINTLLHHCRGFRQDDIERAADTVSQVPLGRTWFRPEGVVATSSFANALQATYSELSKVDLEVPEGLLIGLGFLHGWRRYVCREAQVTLIELNRDTKEIRAKHQSKAPQHKTNQQTTNPRHRPTKTHQTKAARLVSQKGCVSRSKS